MSIDRIERRIANMWIPEIQVKDQVMGKLSNPSAIAPLSKRSSRWLLAAAIVLLLLGTAFISLRAINLYRDDGKLSFTVKNYDETNRAPVLQEELREKYLEMLKPGEAMAIYNPIDNPSQVVTVLQKPEEFADMEEMRLRVQTRFPIPTALPSGMSFIGGTIHHSVGQPDIEKLISRSQAEGGTVTWEKISVDSEIHGVTLNVSKGGSEYAGSIYNGSRWKTVYSDFTKMKETRILPINGTEGLIVSDEGTTALLWRSEPEQGSFFYRITTGNQTTSSDLDLLAVLNALLPNPRK